MAALRHRVLLQAVQEPLPNRSGSKHQPPKRMTNLAPKWHLQSERVRAKRSNLYSSPRRDVPARSPTRRPRRPPPARYAERDFLNKPGPKEQNLRSKIRALLGAGPYHGRGEREEGDDSEEEQGSSRVRIHPGAGSREPLVLETLSDLGGGETGWQNPPSNCSSLLLFLQINAVGGGLTNGSGRFGRLLREDQKVQSFSSTDFQFFRVLTAPSVF